MRSQDYADHFNSHKGIPNSEAQACLILPKGMTNHINADCSPELVI